MFPRRIGTWRCLFASILFILFICVFLLFGRIPENGLQKGYPSEGRVSFRFFDQEDSIVEECIDDLDRRIVEQRAILSSMRNELLQETGKLRHLRAESERLIGEKRRKEEELREFDQMIERARLLLRDYEQRRSVVLRLPHPPLRPPPLLASTVDRLRSEVICRDLDDAFDYRRCSISTTDGGAVFIYDLSPDASPLARSWNSHLRSLSFVTKNVEDACFFVIILEGQLDTRHYSHWASSGWNHLLIDLDLDQRPIEQLECAIRVSPHISSTFRMKFDIFAPLHVPDQSSIVQLSPLLPFSRQYLLSFQAHLRGLNDSRMVMLVSDLDVIRASAVASEDAVWIETNCPRAETNCSGIEANCPKVETNCSGIETNCPKVETNCSRVETNCPSASKDSTLCRDEKSRDEVLIRSVFVLIVPDSNGIEVLSRIGECLSNGAIPVLLSMTFPLPFEDLIDWRRVVFRLPLARLPELHFILRSIAAEDIIEMRRRGRFVLEHFLVDKRAVAETIFAAMRHRILQPAPVIAPFHSVSVFNDSFIAPSLTSIFTTTEPPEYLGPPESPYSSLSFRHNFTSMQMYAYRSWNEHGFANRHLLPDQSDEPALPSGVEFEDDLGRMMRPIEPGSGLQFSRAIGGNRAREHFTIIILTYNRDAILAAALQRLHQLPYLHRVLVIWNNVDRLPEGTWPRLHVPVLFINASRNSLNNRFLPYDQIETEAVFSLDDDVELQQHEIIFAFRVWREQRDKIVGFPARYHARFDGVDYYNSNHTCQLSMILTGAAFLHRHYLYAYSQWMPSIIRDKVDEWMNCEDLAINFLIAHMTRQPPIKTTSRWTFRCAGCTEKMSSMQTHYAQRDECLRFLISVYGYNPLLFTQFRVDTVLFKTKLPPEHQKCSKFI